MENFEYKKQIKLDDEQGMENNVIRIIETPNMKVGTGTRIWECVIY